MSRASVFDWYKLFKEGRERVEDDVAHVNRIKKTCAGKLSVNH